MIVRQLEDVLGSPSEVRTETWVSRRLLLRRDDLGYSFHDTVMRGGTETPMWYRHHVEAVYCVAGEGLLRNLEAGETHRLAPGTLYVLNGHERHSVRADSDLRLLCIFTPPCTGSEIHDAQGSYPAPTAP